MSVPAVAGWVAGRDGRKGMRAAALLAVLAAVAGCGSMRAKSYRPELVPFTPAEASLMAQARSARYRLAVGDLFDVRFKYQSDLNQDHVVVLPDGRCTILDQDDVQVAGLTVQEVDSVLTARFARDYRHPDLSILISQLGSTYVYVLGEVTLPGLQSLPAGGGGVLQAVAAAGGFSPNAATSETVVIRVTPEGYVYRRCDLSHLEKLHMSDPGCLDLEPYDVVYVPRSAIGDFTRFNQTVLTSLLNLGSVFWDVYGVANLEKVDRLTR